MKLSVAVTYIYVKIISVYSITDYIKKIKENFGDLQTSSLEIQFFKKAANVLQISPKLFKLAWNGFSPLSEAVNKCHSTEID